MGEITHLTLAEITDGWAMVDRGLEMHIERLGKSYSKEEQEQAISYLAANLSAEEAKSLIIPGTDKSVWENCAKTIEGMDPEDLVQLLPDLMEWLRDRNWPGYQSIERIAMSQDPELVESAVSSAIEKASVDGDVDWLENLGSLKIK